MSTTISVENKIPDEADVVPIKSKRGPRGQVVFFGKWCKGCGLCAAFCPAGVLELNADGHPYAAHPEKCTACRWCEYHCPDLAILVRRIDG